MKKWAQIVFIAGLASVFCSAPAVRAEDHTDKKGDHHEMMEQKWKEKLGLSDDQATKLKAAMKDHREAMKALHEQAKGDMKKLADQIKNKAGDSDIQATLDSLKKVHQSMQDEHEKLTSNLSSFLTPTQRGKMLLHMMHHMRDHHEMGGHEGYGKGGHGNEHGASSDMKDSLNDMPEPVEAE